MGGASAKSGKHPRVTSISLLRAARLHETRIIEGHWRMWRGCRGKLAKSYTQPMRTTKRLSLFVSSVLLSLIVAPISAVSVSASATPEALDEYIIVGGQTFSAEANVNDLDRHLVGDRNLASPANVIPEYRIVNSWFDHQLRRVVIRQTAADKLRIKHNVSVTMARVATQYPDTSVAGANTDRVYRAEILRIVSGRVADRTTLKVVVEFGNRQADGHPYGVVTAYCEGVSKCPDWATRILNA